MKVISLWEPWASLLKENIKMVETRSFKTNYRGEIYIHASLKKVNLKDKNIINLVEFLRNKDFSKNQNVINFLEIISNKNFNYGNIIAKCKIIDCVYMDEKFVENMKQQNPTEFLCGDYRVGRYAWILSDITPLENPISAKGQLGVWNYYS